MRFPRSLFRRGGISGIGAFSPRFTVSLRNVRVRPLDLHETLAADRVTAAPRVVEMIRISSKADGAIFGVAIEHDLERLAVDKRFVGEGDFAL